MHRVAKVVHTTKGVKFLFGRCEEGQDPIWADPEPKEFIDPDAIDLMEDSVLAYQDGNSGLSIALRQCALKVSKGQMTPEFARRSIQKIRARLAVPVQPAVRAFGQQESVLSAPWVAMA